MKNLAVIGASYLQLPLVKKAKEMGLHTLCFAWAEGAVCKDVADEFFPISVIEKEQILQICREKQIDGICTIASDVSAPTVAYVAEHLGLVGNSYEASIKANDKYLMRNAFVSAGVPCPSFQLVTDVSQLNPNAFHYPVIVKPTDRSGSIGIMKVEHSSELLEVARQSLNFSFKKEALIEDYVEGREISAEFISYQGKHYPLQITDKVTTGAPHFVELEHHQPADLNKEQFARIYVLTEKALNALGITNGASHSEYKITSDGRIVVMEIGARMGGDFIGSDLVQLSTGYDYLKGVIEVALGQFEEPAFGEPCYAGVYFLCEETKHLQNIIKESNNSTVVRTEITDAELRKVTCSADRSGYLIYQGNNKLIL